MCIEMKFRLSYIFVLFMCVSPSSWAEQFKIGFVSDGSVEALRVEGLVEKELAVLLGTDVMVDKVSFTGSLSSQSFNSMLEKAYADSSIDAVVAPGFYGSNFLYNHVTFQKPTLLSWVIDPGIFGATIRKDRNLFWLSARNDFGKTLDNIKEIVNPKVITFLLDAPAKAFLSSSSGSTKLSLLDAVIKKSKTQGIEAKVVAIDLSEPVSSQVPKDTDLVMLPPFDSGTDEIIASLIQAGYPAYSFAGDHVVKQGALMSDVVSADEEILARRIALDLYSLYKGERIESGPRWLEPEHHITLNMGVARKLGVDMSIDVISNATLVGFNTDDELKVNIVGIIDWTLEKNLLLAQSHEQRLLADENVVQNRSALRPQLNAQLNHNRRNDSGASVNSGSPEHDTQASLVVSQNIYSVERSTNYETALLGRKASDYNYTATEYDSVLNVTLQYLAVLSAEATVNSAIENLQLSRSNYSISNKRSRLGSGTKGDVYDAEAAIATAESNLLAARIQSFEARRAVMETANKRFDENAIFEPVDLSHRIFSDTHSLIQPLLETLGGIRKFAQISAELAKQADPTLLSSNVNLESNKLLVDAARRSRYSPVVSLNGQAFRYLDSAITNSGSDLEGVDDWSVGINVEIPVWTSGRLNSLVRQANQQKQAAELALQATENSVDTTARNGAFSLAQAWRDIKLGKIELESSEKSLHINQKSYANGAITIDALQNAQAAYISALNSTINDKYQYLQALASWQNLVTAMPVLMSKDDYAEWMQSFKQRLGGSSVMKDKH